MKSPGRRWVRRAAAVLALFAVFDYLVLPQVAGTQKSLHLLSSIRPWWAVTAFVLEALSLVSYSMLSRTVFPDSRPPFSILFRIDLTALGVSHVLPGGAAASSALRYRLLREGGIPAEDAAVGMAVQGVGSNLVLAALTWVALVASIFFVGLRLLYVAAAVAGGLLVASTLVLISSQSRRTTQSRDTIQRVGQRVPLRFRARFERALRAGSGQLHQLLGDRRALRSSAGCSAGNWLLDAASLWVFLAAYGQRLNPVGLLVAYGIANLVAIVPVSPGGLGVIEAILIPSLVGFGTPRAVAVLAVVSWRLINFWAPVPIAGISYLSLRTGSWRVQHEARRA